ncbi:MAG TPA: TonB-dependent receptor [Vicinamibacterales bacterium]|nr:TonB-dependent receptor [Vicinamibacterales bacterium]
MNALCRVALAIGLVASVTVPSSAQQPAEPPATPPAAGQQPASPEPAEPTYEETVVVSGSRAQEKLVNTPVTMTVIGPRQIESATSQNFAELLRTVPGLNITQTSARDINVTSRAATGTLATGQLALLDGRSLYQDFFGFVMWDFLPVNLNEIKQVEVIRGPASAVWGANALYGVINVITKTPREMQGTTATLGVGAFERSGGEDAGSLWYLSGTHATAINDRWAFKLSAGGYVQDPLSRPTGFIPGSPKTPAAPNGTPYPAYRNTGTTQPKFDGRLDYDYEDGRQLSFTGGVSGTEGIMHTGIGPFDINNGTIMSYGRVNFSRKGLRVSAFNQGLDGDASNLLTRDPLGRPIQFSFKTNTSDVDVTNVQTFAKRHVLTYGGNLRYNKFDLSLAPEADNRVEFGVYAQDEIFLSDHFRLSLGGRVDRFDYLDNFVFSPRVALLVKPVQNHTFRLSYNRAYRSPSVINNFLDISIAEPLRLAPTLVYPLPVRSVGDADLKETSLDAYEVGYTGVLAGRTVLSAAYYVNKSKNDILFTEVRSARYTASNPPPGWPLSPLVIPAVTGGAGFPALFTYQNFGKTTQKGLELGLDTPVARYLNVFANYSWQGKPEPTGFDISELNLPPKNRYNLGASIDYARFLGNVSVSYSDSAFWQDVLDDRYHGTTKAYTLVNAGFGVKWGTGDQISTSVKVMNLANQDIQQHVFGDVTKRQIVGELRVGFGGTR